MCHLLITNERERHREAEILMQLFPSVSISCDERDGEGGRDKKTEQRETHRKAQTEIRRQRQRGYG